MLADYVTTEDGTGLVHQSPAFGADDIAVCRAYGLPVVNPVRPDGHFADDVPLVGGQFFKNADADLVARPRARAACCSGTCPTSTPTRTAGAATPRCSTTRSRPGTSAPPRSRTRCSRENEHTNWYPETIKWGRYGDWLHNNIDWALSRSRYWGTPLPIWRCDGGPPDRASARSPSWASWPAPTCPALDPHRPYVDDVTFACPDVRRPRRRRVPEVIDAWFDSGSMPFAQWGYPHVEGSEEKFEQAYPAEFICEAIDQTRGWFYTLMAVGTLVFDESSYENVLCLGHILAEDGRKMTKHLGNILEPIPLMDEHGADAVRWFMAACGSPWAARRVGHTTIQETVRKVLLTYWNTVAFQCSTPTWPAGRRAADVPPAPPTGRCSTAGRSPRRTGWSAT